MTVNIPVNLVQVAGNDRLKLVFLALGLLSLAVPLIFFSRRIQSFEICRSHWKGSLAAEFLCTPARLEYILRRDPAQLVDTRPPRRLASLLDVTHKVLKYDVAARKGSGPWSRAFHLNSTTIVSVLLQPLNMENPMKHTNGCRLGSVTGRVTQVRRSRETYGHSWDAFIVYCRFDPSDLAEIRRSGMRSPTVYSKIEFRANNERIMAEVVSPQRPVKPFYLAMCVPPVHGTVRFQWLKEWILLYHEYIQVEHTFLYSSWSSLRVHLTKVGVDMRQTPFSVLDMSTQKYDQHYRGQPLSMYDCLFLNRYLETRWTIFQDLDEVIWLPPKWHSLAHLLSSVEMKYDAVSFGKWNATVRSCRPRTPHFSAFLDRMNVFNAMPRCGELCPSWRGGRKFVAKPSRVEYVFIHYPGIREQKNRTLLDLSLSQGFMRHYQRVANLNIHTLKIVCSEISWRKTLRTATLPFKEFSNARPMNGLPY